MKRVCCLYRVSTLGQVEKDDIPMQKQCCHEFVEAQGWHIVKEYSEKGVSGYKVAAKDRDAIQEIKKGALGGQFDVLLVFMFDRLGRRDDESPFVVEWFTKHGVEVWSTQEGQQRFDNHVDKLTNYLRFWQASGESEKTSIRTKTRLGQIVQEGRFKGGFCPYGYKLEKMGRTNNKGHEVNDIFIEDYEATIVRIIFEKYVNEGVGTHRIAMYLTEQGVKSRSGLSWHPSTILHMLKNIMYTGVLRSGESKSAVFEHLQIVDEDTFERAQRLVNQRSKKNVDERSVPLNTKGKSLLSGNIFCGHCGGRLTPTTSGKKLKYVDGIAQGKKKHYYVCYNKSRKRCECDGQYSYMTHIIDEIVEGTVKRLFSKLTDSPNEAIVDSYYSSKLRDCQVSLNNAQKVYEQAVRDLATLEAEVMKSLSGAGQFAPELLNKLIAQKAEEISMAEKDIAVYKEAVDNDLKILGDAKVKYKELLSWAAMFDGCTSEAKKMIVSCLINRVTVRRGYDLTIEFNADFEQFGLD